MRARASNASPSAVRWTGTRASVDSFKSQSARRAPVVAPVRGDRLKSVHGEEQEQVGRDRTDDVRVVVLQQVVNEAERLVRANVVERRLTGHADDLDVPPLRLPLVGVGDEMVV